MSQNPQQDTLHSDQIFGKSNISPKKKGSFDKNQDPLFMDALDYTNGASIFGKPLNGLAVFGQGSDSNLLFNDYHWDNNQLIQPSLLSRGPSICDQPASKKFKLADDTSIPHQQHKFTGLFPNADTPQLFSSVNTTCQSIPQQQLQLLSSTTQSDTSAHLNQSLSDRGVTSSASFQASFGVLEDSNASSSLVPHIQDNSSLLSGCGYSQKQIPLLTTTNNNNNLTKHAQNVNSKKGNNRRDAKEEEKSQKLKKASAAQANSSDQNSEAVSNKKQKNVTFHTTKSNAAAAQKVNNDESTYGGNPNETTMEMFQRLTNKKREYLEEDIQDKNGHFCYDEDPSEYKKARKRMQNRESAVRSRLRKKYHQDELEIKIQELEKIQKDISEQNAGLAAQNALLKKQLAYFEDIFAKSSLLGFDPVAQNAVNKNDLEKFQNNLLKKINQRLYQPTSIDCDMNEVSPLDGSLELHTIRASKNILDEGDSLSSTSISNQLNHQNLHSLQQDDRIESLRLVRSRSNSSNFSNTGYLFLAIVFCMMCCSSLLVTPSSMIKMASQTQGFSKILNGGGASSFSVTNNRKLMSAPSSPQPQTKLQQSAQSLSTPLNEDIEMTTDTVSTSSRDVQNEEPEIGAVQLMKMLLAGQYTYLTYMLLSTTCFFFWLMPNCHKIRKLFSFSNKGELEVILKRRQQKPYFQSSHGERQVLTRSQAYKVTQRS